LKNEAAQRFSILFRQKRLSLRNASAQQGSRFSIEYRFPKIRARPPRSLSAGRRFCPNASRRFFHTGARDKRRPVHHPPALADYHTTVFIKFQNILRRNL
jgi:hypothetical protein